VSKEAFEGVLNGILPGGEAVAQVENRRAGVDLTFSAPKSVSVLAYVAGDKRILGPDGANMKAVTRAMAWVESNLAEGRKDIEGRKVRCGAGTSSTRSSSTTRAAPSTRRPMSTPSSPT
jgi:conjugative relaxase-like TrwC/TraI family protein